MEMEPELRDIFKNQANGDKFNGEGVKEDNEGDPKPIFKNKKKPTSRRNYHTDDKSSLQKKLLAFNEITKDEAARRKRSQGNTKKSSPSCQPSPERKPASRSVRRS